ncbi:MAG: subtilisin-like proprotein convertase family protein [Salibacteraceae bacterium]|jgi:subtilisin-like proprotein convertase family protein
MYKKLLRLTLSLLFLWTASPAVSQNIKTVDFTMNEVSRADILGLGDIQINAENARYYHFDIDALKSQMAGVMYREDPGVGFLAQLKLPHPNGVVYNYQAKGNRTMHSDLGVLFPEITSYDAAGLDNVAKVKWDITPAGFHAMIMLLDESTIFIDPVINGNSEYYIVYHRNDFSTDKIMDCDVTNNDLTSKLLPAGGVESSFGTCELRTYRMALAATAEYTIFHGGTVAGALAAEVTTMNRVNGVFERDMAITMSIVANNNLLIYTNTGTDPYTNGNAGAMIGQNQTNVDNVIGSGNYDIGHVFGTNSGGLAGLGVVCLGGQKARGVTGSGAPIGDPFDIDYVAHEVGHQFDANHTQNNNCNRNNATAMEPGSASTIMGYAGICAPNVQNNSDDHFHGVSLEEIGGHITSTGCPVTTALANNAPSISGTNGNATIPSGTPFALTAIATDLDGDVLSYCWEQMDNGVSTQSPVGTSTIGPNFRSISPMVNDTRYFPNLTDLSNGGPYTWEVLPTVSRSMNFRVTVRDQSLGVAGCNDHADVVVTVDGNSGPFILNYPSATGIVWAGATTETVTWAVAGTDLAPVNCSNVDILLSTDGGLTYPTVLMSNVPNDGSQLINIPNIATTTARVMVICASGTFFDISNNDFEITMATFDYTLGSATPAASVCQPTDAVYTIDVGSIGGYNDPVTLSITGVPTGATAVFSTNPVTPVGTSTLTISNTGSATAGTYGLTVQGVSTSGTKTTDLSLNISSASPLATTLTTPANLAVSVAVPTDFTWVAAPGAGITYEIDIATDAGFTTIVDQTTGLVTTTYNSATLLGATTYFWRVRSVTGCGTSAWSVAWSFTTSTCSNIASTDVGQTSDVASFTSVINIAGSGTITDVNVPIFDMSHPWIGDIRVELMSPLGTVVSLFDRPGYAGTGFGCNGDDIDVSFDDGAAANAAALEGMCAAGTPTISGAFQSIDPLSDFNGESITGVWTLTVYDDYTQGDDGTLNAWSLELCTVPVNCNNPDVPSIAGLNAVCEGSSITLSIGTGNLNDAADWNWYSGSCGGTLEGSGSTLAVSPLTSTSYFVRGEGGCVVPGACVQVDVAVTTVDVSVTETLPTITANATGATYQWVDCDNGNAIIPGATSASYTPIADVGNYAVMVTQNGCTEMSPCYSVDQTGINELTSNNLLVFPNPTSDKVSVTWDGSISYIEITDVRGRLLNRVEVSDVNKIKLDVETYRSGVYLLRVVGDNGSTVIDLIKQ